MMNASREKEDERTLELLLVFCFAFFLDSFSFKISSFSFRQVFEFMMSEGFLVEQSI